MPTLPPIASTAFKEAAKSTKVLTSKLEAALVEKNASQQSISALRQETAVKHAAFVDALADEQGKLMKSEAKVRRQRLYAFGVS